MTIMWYTTIHEHSHFYQPRLAVYYEKEINNNLDICWPKVRGEIIYIPKDSCMLKDKIYLFILLRK